MNRCKSIKNYPYRHGNLIEKHSSHCFNKLGFNECEEGFVYIYITNNKKYFLKRFI